RVAEERPERLVRGELDAALGIPHHDRSETGAARALLGDVVGVEADFPEGLEAEDLAVPRDDGLHREPVRRDVIDVRDPEDVVRLALVAHAAVDEAGGEGAEIAALDEAERDVPKRGRDLDGAVAAAALVLRF